MPDRPVYLLPFRLIVLGLLAACVVGGVGGGIGSWIVLRRLLRVTPGGERVIERVEHIVDSSTSALPAGASKSHGRVAALVDERGRVLQYAVGVTTDGVFVSVGQPPRGSLTIRAASGVTLPASVARVYPESGVFFLRTSGSSPVQEVRRESDLLPGTRLAAVALNPLGDDSPKVRVVSVEGFEIASSALRARVEGLARVPVLAEALPPSFQGTPLVDADGRAYGVALVDERATILLPMSVVEDLLQDLSRHSQETSVRVLSGLRGSWRVERAEPEKYALHFRVREVAAGSSFAAAGLRPGDVLERVHGEEFRGVAPLFLVLLAAARRGEPLELSVRRGADTFTVSVSPILEPTL